MYLTVVMMTMMMMLRYPENACTFYPSHTIFSEATSYADCADEHLPSKPEQPAGSNEQCR